MRLLPLFRPWISAGILHGHTSTARAIYSVPRRRSIWSCLKPPIRPPTPSEEFSPIGPLEGALTDLFIVPQVHGVESNPPYTLLCIPRARRVHQPLITTPVTAAYSLIVSLYHIALAPVLSGKPFADVLILNGPGTCCMLCLAVYFNKARSPPFSSSPMAIETGFLTVLRVPCTESDIRRVICSCQEPVALW